MFTYSKYKLNYIKNIKKGYKRVKEDSKENNTKKKK